MKKNLNMDPEMLLSRINYLEENRRLIQNALEMALSLGDFQENVNKGYSANHILKEAEKKIRYLIPFDASAFLLVDPLVCLVVTVLLRQPACFMFLVSSSSRGSYLCSVLCLWCRVHCT